MALNPLIDVQNKEQVIQGQQERADAASPLPTMDANAHLIDRLSQHVETAWQSNKMAKRVIQTTMIDCLRARRGEYPPDKLAAIRQQGGAEIYMMLPSVKCRAAESWIRDVMFPESGERPFQIDPTPLPSIPPDVAEQIRQIAVGELQLAQQQGFYPSPEKLRLRVQQLQIDIKRRVKEAARTACDLMEDEIDDLFTEGEWYKALDECISDFVTLPACVLKGPVMRKGKQLAWGRDANGKSVPIVEDELTPFFYRVSPLDLYPAADSTGPTDGSLIEHVRFRRGALYGMIGTPGYNEQRIRAALSEYTDGYLLNDVQEQEQKQELGQSFWWSANDKPLSALEFHGDVQGAMLLEWGMDPAQIPDPLKEYPIIALKIGRFVVRCIINDDPLGRRPYDTASFEKVVGAFWGQGVTQLMFDLTDICNATARALINNMGFASGPMMEIEVDRLAEGEKIEQLSPWRIFQTKSAKTSTPSPAIRWHQPSMVADVLMQVYTYFSRLADDYTGIPAYAYGSSAVGGAATTSSGLSQLMSNAARGIKRAIARFDSVIDGSAKRTHAHVLMYVEDTSLHGDIRIYSRGASSLVSREQAQRAKLDFLTATANPVDQGIIGPIGRARILRDVVHTFGIPIEQVIPDDDELRAKMKAEMMQQAAASKPPEPPLQQTALQGPQIAALTQILADVKAGIIGPDSAQAAIAAAFPGIPPNIADALFQDTGQAPSKARPPTVPGPASGVPGAFRTPTGSQPAETPTPLMPSPAGGPGRPGMGSPPANRPSAMHSGHPAGGLNHFQGAH